MPIIRDDKKYKRIYSDKEAESIKVQLRSSDGKKFGEISAGAFSAIKGGYLIDYSPVDDNEKKILNEYKKYMSKNSTLYTDYIPGFGLTKDEYNRRRASNKSLPAFGSYEYFVKQEKEVGKLLDDANREAFNYTDDFHAELADTYENNPEILKKQGLYDEGKKAYHAFQTQKILAKEYDKIVEYKDKFKNTKGVNKTDSGEVDTESGKKEAKEESVSGRRLKIASSAKTSEEAAGYFTKEQTSKSIKEKANEFNKNRAKERLADEKYDAYEYYEENKDNRYSDNPVGRAQANARKGDINQRIGNRSGKAAYDLKTDDLEATEVYQALQQRLIDKNKNAYTNRNLIDSAVASVAEYVPQFRDQSIASIKGYAFGALSGFSVGGVGGAFGGARIGGAATSAAQMFNQTAGATYVQLLQESDLSPEEAHRLSRNNAIASSAIEFGLEYALSGMFKKGEAIVKKVTGSGADAAEKKFVSALKNLGLSELGQEKLKTIAKKTGTILLTGLGEGVEEGTQTFVEKGAERLAKEGKKTDMLSLLLESIQLNKLSEEDWKEVGESTAAGALLGMFSYGVKSGSFKTIHQTAKTASKYISDKKLGKNILSNQSGDLRDTFILSGLNSSDEKTKRLAEEIENKVALNGNISASKIGSLAKKVLAEDIDIKSVDYDAKNESVSETVLNEIVQKNEENNTNLVRETEKQSDSNTEISPMKRYTSSDSSIEIVNYEDKLILDGVSDSQREKIINNLQSINHSSSVGISGAIDTINASVKHTEQKFLDKIGATGDRSVVLAANTDFVSSPENLFSMELVNAYADYYVEALENKKAGAYTRLGLSNQELQSAVIHYTLTGYAGEHLSQNQDFISLANGFKELLTDGLRSNYNLYNILYSESPKLKAQMSDINEGDFAIAFSEKYFTKGESLNKDIQVYNIIVSNLKRKAEELGLLDSTFFKTLQNVNLYNPTTSDRVVISSEFRRVFAGNTDPLVASWLNGLDNIIRDTTSTILDESGMKNKNFSTGATESETQPQYNHLYDEEKVSKEYLDSVNSEIENAIISIRSGDLDSVPDVIDVAVLEESTIKKISNFVGFDISGYVCKIERDRLMHIEKRHGINGEHDHSLSDPKDIARMGYVVNNSDNIDWVVDNKGNRVYDKQYNDKNNKPSPVIMLNSKIDGTYCIGQAVPDSKKKTLWITSARIQKAAVGSQVPYDSNATPQLQTSRTPLVSSSASNNIVSQDNNIVNSSVRNNAENDSNATKTKSGVKSSRDIADNDSISRWTTERIEKKKKKDKAEENKDNQKEENQDKVAKNTKSKSPVSISEIIKKISSEFGIPISTGKVTDREASGIYKEKPETIRTKISNNLPTISHELGHHLDKKYNLNELSNVESIKKIVSEDFLEKYPDDVINSELVAEFVRHYLKNSNEANRLCPDFYNDFVRTLSKEDLAAVNRVAKQINEYLSYDIGKRYEASIISAKKAKKMQKLPFSEKWKNLYTGWIDKFHPIKQITGYVSEVKGSELAGVKNAYVLATNSLNAHTIANYQVCEGFRDLNGNFIDGAKSLVECIGMVNSKDITTFDLYLKLKHALEVIGKGKRVFADEVLEDTDNIEKKIAEIEEEHSEMIEAANNLYEFQYNMLKYFAVPSGIMTMEQVDYLHHEYPCYVPFYRFIKNKKGGMFAKSSFVNQSSPIMRQTGSGLDTLSHLESIIRNVEKVIKASVRNQTAAVIGSYADNVDGIGQFIEKVDPDKLPHIIDITALKEDFTNRLQEVIKSSDDFFAISELMDEVFGDDVTDFTPIANESKKIISVMRGGERSYYQIHDDALFSAVAELSPQQANGWIRICNTIMQPMKLLITQNNPIFAATNALRDFGTAYKLSEINNPIVFATQYIKALGGIITNSEDYKKYKAMGGGHSSELSANIENISKTLRRVAQKDMGKARRLVYSIFLHPVNTVASINDAIESIPRFMEFERTLKENGDLQKAIFNANDITTNFKRSGSSNTAKFVNSSIMFNNAAIQGLDKVFRTITEKDPKKRYGTLLKWLLHALIMGIVGYIYNKEVDEEGYKNLSSYKKNNFYNFAIGDGKFISLPKPRENALLDTITERTIEYLFGENEEAFYDFGSYLCSQLLPPMFPDTLHPIDAVHSIGGSTIFGGLLDVGFNKDFKGTPIESDYDKYIPSNERYTESTTKAAYALGQTKLAIDLDMSPKKIDHLISSYTGIFGQLNKALFPMNENRRDISFGLRNKFISDSNYSTDLLNKMYENQEKAEKAFNYSGSIGDAIEYEKNSVITSYISEMNKAIKILPEEKQREGRAFLLKSLNGWNYDSTDSQEKMLNRFENDDVSDDCIITDVPKSSLEWTVTKKDKWGRGVKDSNGKTIKIKYTYQMTPQEYTEYVKDYLNFVNMHRLYYNKEISSNEDYKIILESTKSDVKKVLSKKYQKKYLDKATKRKLQKDFD